MTRAFVLSLAGHGGAAALALWLGAGAAGAPSAEAPDTAPVRFSLEAPAERPSFAAAVPSTREIETAEPAVEAPPREDVIASGEGEPAPPPPPALRAPGEPRAVRRPRVALERLPSPPAEESTVEPRRRSENAPPPYPEAARRRGAEGLVELLVKVCPAGRVVDVAVLRSSGHASLDEAALEAVRTWSFDPAHRGGRPSEGETRVSLRFRLTGP